MTSIALESETNNYWSLIKDASREVKLALIEKLATSLHSLRKKPKNDFDPKEFEGMWSDDNFPDADEMVREIQAARTSNDRMEKFL